MKSRDRQNAFIALKVGKGWIERDFEISQEIIKYLSDIFKESNVD